MTKSEVKGHIVCSDRGKEGTRMKCNSTTHEFEQERGNFAARSIVVHLNADQPQLIRSQGSGHKMQSTAST